MWTLHIHFVLDGLSDDLKILFSVPLSVCVCVCVCVILKYVIQEWYFPKL
jgi:hypothetical protein